jgi:hypothetical protein
MSAMNNDATTYPTTGTPSPPVMPELLPLVVVVLGTIALLLLGAPPS